MLNRVGLETCCEGLERRRRKEELRTEVVECAGKVVLDFLARSLELAVLTHEREAL